MRNLQKDLKQVYVFREWETEQDVNDPNFYPGKRQGRVYSHQVRCNIQPADSSVTAQAFGRQCYEMMQLMCDAKADIVAGDRLSLDRPDRPTHRIASIKQYGTHKILLAEVLP